MASLSRRLFVLLLLSQCGAILAAIVVLAFGDPSGRWPIVAVIVGIAVLLAIVLLLAVRITAYRALVAYDPRRDYEYDLSRICGESATVLLNDGGFDWPAVEGQFDTAILAFTPTATLGGKWLDPHLEIRCGGSVWQQWFERGVSGLRFVDLTPCLTEPSVNKQRVRFIGRRMHWAKGARLLLLQNDLPPETRVLVVAPHPDDAEIAAFVVYRRSNSSIVTLCAGNEGAHLYRQARGEHVGPADLPAAVRVRESITVPFLAGVHPSRCANLCYADNSLAALYGGRASASAASSLRLPDAPQLRAMNLATQLFHVARLPESWSSLIDDLAEILAATSPTVVFLPHPLLESHADHCFAAVAVIDAVRQSARNDIRFLFYVVHPRGNESHPLGPATSASSLPPNFGRPVEPSGIFSQWLTSAEQSLKRAALEAMSDLRPLPAAMGNWRGAFKEFIGQMYEAVSGCPRNPHCFFRRAVRPNEMFFAAGFADAERIVEQFLKQSGEIVKHSRA